MARNVEIKANIDSIESVQELVADLANRGPEVISHIDTYYRTPEGRLKLREFSEGTAELILYRRPDTRNPTESCYERSPVENDRDLGGLLEKKLGAIGCVEKNRTVYWIGRTRVHLDRVSGLGDFLELEVVLEPEESAETGAAEARHLMRLLEIREEWLISESYIDLVNRDSNQRAT